MLRDYFLYHLTWEEFEELVIIICERWFGIGTTGFAAGKDGGRDAKFTGTAACYPSTSKPWVGNTVIQAKHSATPNASCSDSDFKKYYVPDKGQKKVSELPKIEALKNDGIVDHYIVFTNRKLTAGAEKSIFKNVSKLGVSAAVIGLEKINLFLKQNPDVARALPTSSYARPFEFSPNDMVEVITELHEAISIGTPQFDSETDFTAVNKKKVKNKINKMSSKYYQDVVVNQCMPVFHRMRLFLENERNTAYRDIYHDIADELRQKIILFRDKFDYFEEIIVYLFDEVKQSSPELRGRRRYVTFLLCYMYFDCDIGEREPDE